MYGSAFQPIHDPSDPAWDGYADLVEAPGERRSLARWIGGAIGLALLLAVAAWLLVSRDGAAPEAQVSASAAAVAEAPAGGSVAGAPGAEPIITPPPAHVDANVRVPVATPARRTGDRGASGEAGLMESLLAERREARPLTVWHADLSGLEASSKPWSITGDLRGLNQGLYLKLDQLAKLENLHIEVISGLRSREEQASLFAAFLNGTGNLAAPPGRSNHEGGNAADVYVGNVAIGNVPGASAAMAQLGLGLPVPGEAWHVELVGAS